MAKFPLPIGAVTGTVQQMEYRLVPILHPLHAIGRTALSFLHTYLATNRCKASPGMIRREVQGSVFLYFGIGGAVTGRVHRMTPQGGDIRCTRLGEQLFLSDMLIPPPIAVRQVPVRLGERFKPLFFWLSSAACRAPNLCFMAKPLPIGAVTGTVQQMEYRLVPILHPLHAIGRRYFNFFSQLLVPPIAVTQVPVCSGAYLILNICKRSVFYFRNGRCGYRDLVTDIRGIFKNFVYKY